jgi:hypothetical protein
MSRAKFPFASALIIGAIAALGASAAAVDVPSKQDALRFQAKVDRIERNAVIPRRGPQRMTELTESEVNAYLKYLAGPQIPAGIVDPVLFAQGNGRVAGRAVVDLDAVRTQKVRAWTDPMGYLTGRLPISVEGIVTTHDGMGRFQLISAEISGVTIPKTLLQELLSYYSRTPDTPSGINMDDPFALPDGIREIRIGQGSAVVVQ